MEESRKNLQTLLIETLRARGFSIEKLSTMTGVPERFLHLLVEEQYDRLPAAPYVRGYLLKVAEALNLDGNRLWRDYLEDNETVRRSGKRDELPPNRFAISPINKKVVILIGVVVLVLAFLAFRLPTILGIPELSINLEDNTVLQAGTVTLSGTIDPNDQLTINGELIYPDANGAFETTAVLQPGFNTFTFIAKRFLGKEKTIVRQVFYQEPTSSPATPTYDTE